MFEDKVVKEGVVKKDGILYHSSPPSTKLYDSIWEESHGLKNENYTKPRSEEIKIKSMSRLSLLLFPNMAVDGKNSVRVINFNDPISALDVCAGHGEFSLAVLDMGAGSVHMCDGSEGTLKNMSNHLTLNENYKKYRDRLTPIQVDVENICSAFEPESFDLVFQRYAIHHMRNPMRTVYDLATLVKPGGALSFNYFVTGCTPQISRDLRSHFLTKNTQYVRNFFRQTERIKVNSKNSNALVDALSGKISIDGCSDTIDYLRSLSKKYGIDALSKRLHYEDANTPYVHNIDHEKMKQFVTEELGLIVHGWRSTSDEASLTLMVPEQGVRMNPWIPSPSEYSDEDVKLGDNLISLLKEG